jgi:DNA repair exonuclease SbcCD nuclease subunit
MASPSARDICVVHTSDLHLDHRAAPSGESDGARTLALVLATARRVGADKVLLAGDTFDSHRQPAELVDRVAGMVAAAALPVVLLPGNHDPIVPEAVYHRIALAGVANLHILGMTHGEALVFPELDLEVWGRPHRTYGDMIPFEQVRPRRTRWQIAMGHGHYVALPDRSTRYRPSWLIGEDELAATRCDYVALGHWNCAANVGNGAVPAFYSGSPEHAGTVNVVRFTAKGEVQVTLEAVQ